MTKLLHGIISWSHTRKWNSQSKAGALSTAIGASPLSMKPLFDGSITPECWRFIHKARTSTLPVNNRFGSKFKACRKCCYSLETQAHIFCHCGPSSGFRIGRHNDVLELLAGTIRTNTTFEVIVDQVCDFVNKTDRVDLQLINRNTKKIVLLDLKVPYDTSSNLKLARDNNIAKYTPLKEEIKKNLPSWTVILETISIGCFGSWSIENEAVLKMVGLKSIIIRKFAIASITKCIAWSTKNWRFHESQSNNNMEESKINNANTDESDSPIEM